MKSQKSDQALPANFFEIGKEFACQITWNYIFSVIKCAIATPLTFISQNKHYHLAEVCFVALIHLLGNHAM